jgi:FHA domain
MQRILIRHISGTRANQVDEFQAEGLKEIFAGRDESTSIRFDPDREDLVSRNHVKIYADAGSPNSYLISDLQSRNGTFLNRQRVSAPSRIQHGDVVQLGAGGPEFRFEVDPPPAGAVRPTRVVGRGEADAMATAMSKPTRLGSLADVTSASSPRPVGRATVERMLGDTFGKVKRESGKTMWVGIAAVIMIAALGVGAYTYLHYTAAENAKRMHDQQQLLLQMAQVVKQQPTNDAAVKTQMQKLTGEMTRIIAQNQAQSQGAGSGGAASSASGGGASKSAAGGNSPYDTGLTQAEQLFNANDFTNAYAECVKISTIDPSRWEGYYIAGLSAEQLSEPDKALTAYNYALQEQPPDDFKATITARVQALQGGAGQAN